MVAEHVSGAGVCLALFGLLASAAGCAEQRREGGGGGAGSGLSGQSTGIADGGGTTAPHGSAGAASSTAPATGGSGPGSDGGSGPGADDDGPTFDVATPGGDGPAVNDDECQKIDFLFVVDNSASMLDEQQALLTSYPQFISTIQSTVNAQDYHVMVLDTDDVNNPICTGLCEVFPECNGQPCTDFPTSTACDDMLGAGLVKDANGALCGLTDGTRYVDDTNPDPVGAFECLAAVGIGGQDGERPMQAIVDALAPDGPSGCNAGFLRDDALLVITFLTDEEDDIESPGDPASWRQSVVASKGANEDAVVVLGLVGDTDVPGGVCGFAEDAPRLRAFAESFAFGSWGSICAADYGPFFASAVEQIDVACERFGPEG